MEKKKKFFYDYKPLKDQYEPLLESCKTILKTPELLVNNNILYDLSKTYIPNWKYLTSIQKIALFFEHVVNDTWQAFTLIFSNDFTQKCNLAENKSDFIRRRINQNFINKLRYIPKYLFILEGNESGFHIHGVIQTHNNIEAIKKILKLTAFGPKYKKSPIPESNKIRCKNLSDKLGWACYILKSHRQSKPDCYISQGIIKDTREIYQKIWRIFQTKRISNKLAGSKV